jgi:two-component system sensor histidine kinase GlrK
VVALLIAALLMSARQLELLTELSTRTASQSATAMRASRVLVENTSAMERNARQYAVTNDPALFEYYTARRIDFHNALDLLNTLALSELITVKTRDLLQNEAAAHQKIAALTDSPQLDFEYPVLLESAYELARTTSAWVDSQVVVLRERTYNAQRTLNLQTLLLVCAALGMAAWFIRLIVSPLRQIDNAIYSLGGGAYHAPISIQGPEDLQLLGERLDWLRTRLSHP